jgi:hypothetical protein
MREDRRATADSTMGVIGCLRAGFEMLTRNLWLAVLPVVLDLVLWLGPRVSLGPPFRRLVELLEMRSITDAEVSSQIAQATELLEQFATEFNLLSVLGSAPLLHVPSLLARRTPGGVSPLGEPRVFPLSSVFGLVPWWGGLSLAGLVLGFLYLNEIARHIELPHVLPGDGTGRPTEYDSQDGDTSARMTVEKFLRFLIFALSVMVSGFSVFVLWLLVVALATAIAQPLGLLFWITGVGLISYLALHLLLVIPALLVGSRPLLRAVGESVLLSRMNLSSLLGLVVLAVVTYEGLGYAWSLPSGDSWALLVGIVGNAIVATGLTGAAFLFYRDRLAAAHELSEKDG